MKAKITRNGNIKLVMSYEEADVLFWNLDRNKAVGDYNKEVIVDAENAIGDAISEIDESNF